MRHVSSIAPAADDDDPRVSSITPAADNDDPRDMSRALLLLWAMKTH